jgi:molecular chaperone GrpE
MPRDHYKPEGSVADDGGADAYELDLDEGLPDPESAIRDAVAAVEARRSAEDSAGTRDGDDDTDEEDTEELVRRLRHEVVEARDRSIRTLADFENYRRRVEREREEQRRHAAADVLEQFLEVMDNLARALESAASGEDLRRGVVMIHRQMEDLLGRLGAVPVPAVGSRFDPGWHEAVARKEDPAVDAPTVIEEYQRGYLLHERLLRPARVRVAVPTEPLSTEADASDEAVEG